MNPLEQVWISFVEAEAQARENGFTPGEKAFVNVFVLADCETRAVTAVRNAWTENSFHAVSLERPRPWLTVRELCRDDSPFVDLASAVERTGQPQFRDFHTWDHQG